MSHKNDKKIYFKKSRLELTKGVVAVSFDRETEIKAWKKTKSKSVTN